MKKACASPGHARPDTDPEVRIPRILFADPKQGFLDSLKGDRKASVLPPLLVASGRSAIGIMSDSQHKLAAIFVNPSVASPDALSVVRTARILRPSTPVFVMYEGDECPWSPDLLRKEGVHEARKQDFTYSDIIRQFFPPSLTFDPQDLIGNESKDSTPTGHEVSESDESFVAIPAQTFLSGSKSLFDVYVRLSSGRFLKVLRARDDFTKDRIENYIQEGAEFLYIRRSDHSNYLAYGDKLNAALIHHPNLPLEMKIERTLSQGANLIEFLKDRSKLSAEDCRFTESYIDQVQAVIREAGLEQQNIVVAAFMRNDVLRNHGIATTMLGGLIARNFGFETRKSVSTIGLSCLLHDIALLQECDAVRNEDEAIMTEEQRKVYRLHPLKGANILRDSRGIDPSVINSVANHHRRKNGTGFPNPSGIGLKKLPVPTEIVAIADEVVRQLLLHPDMSITESLAELERQVFPAFAAEVVDSLRKTFRPR